MRYDEVTKMNEKLLEIQATPPPIIEHEEPQPNLADKAISKIDDMLGDGTSTLIAQGLAEGIGKAIPKIVEIGAEFFQKFSSGSGSGGAAPNSARPFVEQPIQTQQPAVNNQVIINEDKEIEAWLQQN